MTDETNDNSNPSADDRQAQIDRMIQSSGEARGEMPALPRTSGHPSMTVRVVPGAEAEVSFHSLEDAKLAEMQAAEPEGDIPDNGKDIDEEMRNLVAEFQKYQSEYDAVRYDPETGAKLPKHTPADRERFLLLARQAMETIEYQTQVNARLYQQRLRKAAEKEQQTRAELEREEWLNQQAIKRADELEIDRRAREILKRRGRG